MTLTLVRVILHTVMHHSSTSNYTPNFVEIKGNFCGRMDGRTFETDCSRPTRKSLPKNCVYCLSSSGMQSRSRRLGLETLKGRGLSLVSDR